MHTLTATTTRPTAKRKRDRHNVYQKSRDYTIDSSRRLPHADHMTEFADIVATKTPADRLEMLIARCEFFWDCAHLCELDRAQQPEPFGPYFKQSVLIGEEMRELLRQIRQDLEPCG